MHSHTHVTVGRLVASGGPVTRAVAVMRRYHAEAHDRERDRLRRLRAQIADTIRRDLDRVERCMAYLDRLTPDADAEPSLGSLDASACRSGTTQEAWAGGAADDREQDVGDEGEGQAGGHDLDAESTTTDDNGIADREGAEEQGFGCGMSGGDPDAGRAAREAGAALRALQLRRARAMDPRGGLRLVSVIKPARLAR